ncbi:uncharacterized protein LOC115316089 [Ixodes scapularis]|uniref:uncharacterized protein LOC115316089 n=1 Tax=Ixodes scapularis TaxID=6945 RepID=UPI001A9DA251|nr:uncharacterized protein LOC115316089 [Ixodes scapularis]
MDSAGTAWCNDVEPYRSSPDGGGGNAGAGFLLASTFLFFAGDDRTVADLLRLDLRLLLFPDVAFLALDLLVVALALLALERDDGRRLVRLLVLRFAGVAEDDLERLLEAAALFLLRPRTREGDVMEAPSPTPLLDAGAMRNDLVHPAWTFSLSHRVARLGLCKHTWEPRQSVSRHAR